MGVNDALQEEQRLAERLQLGGSDAGHPSCVSFLHPVHSRNTVFLALHEPSFLASYRKSTGPLLTLRQFCQLWGCIFICYTLFILFFVPEKEREEQTPEEASISSETEEEPLVTQRHSPRREKSLESPSQPEELSIFQTYHLYYLILHNPYVCSICHVDIVYSTGSHSPHESHRRVPCGSRVDAATDRQGNGECESDVAQDVLLPAGDARHDRVEPSADSRPPASPHAAILSDANHDGAAGRSLHPLAARSRFASSPT